MSHLYFLEIRTRDLVTIVKRQKYLNRLSILIPFQKVQKVSKRILRMAGLRRFDTPMASGIEDRIRLRGGAHPVVRLVQPKGR